MVQGIQGHELQACRCSELLDELEVLRKRNAELESRLSALGDFGPLHTYQRMIDAFPDCMALLSESGIIYAINTAGAHKLGKPAPELVGCDFFAFLPPDDSCVVSFFLAVQNRESMVFREQEGDTVLEYQIFPLDDEGVTVYALRLLDITSSVGASRLLLESNRELEERVASRTAALQVQVLERIRAEEALRREQEFIRLILDTDPNMIAVFSKDGTPLLANHALTRFFDPSKTFSFPTLLAEDSPAFLLMGGALQQSLQEHIAVREERRIEDWQGTYRWYDTVTTPLDMPDGTTCVLCYAMDITVRKVSQLALEQAHSELEERVKERTTALAELNSRLVCEAAERMEAQERIRESEERYRSLFFANQAIKLLLDGDSGVILEVNEAAELFYGYAREELVGQHLEILYADSREEVNKRLKAVLQEGNLSFSIEQRVADGSTRSVEVYSGKIAGQPESLIFSIVHDITERKEAALVIEEQRNHLHALMNAYAHCALLLATDGKIITLNSNALRLLRRAGEGVEGMVLFDVLSKKTAHLHRQWFQRVVNTAKPLRRELYADDVVWDVVYYPVVGSSCCVTGVAVYAEDISFRKQADARVRWLSARVLSAQEEERKRIGRELHDSTAQTLSGIKFMVEAELGVMQRSRVEHDTTALQKVVALLQGAIVELRRVVMDLRPTVLDDLGLFSALRWLTGQFTSMNPHITCSLTLEGNEQVLDEMHNSVLFRVAQEALTNAARHSDAKKVIVSLQIEPDECLLVVMDNGIGIGLQAHKSQGIGLDSMRERLELVRGSLEISSPSSGGTVVHAVMPLSKVAEQPEE